jgi:hypothetical protein
LALALAIEKSIEDDEVLEKSIEDDEVFEKSIEDDEVLESAVVLCTARIIGS